MHQEEALLTTRTSEETTYVGELLGRIIYRPLLISLQGDLGAGKTVLARGVARGLGCDDPVTSPTFVLMHIYKGRMPVYHFDFYRLEADDDPSVLGFNEYLPGDGVALVEWGDRLPGLMPEDYLILRLEFFHDHRGEGRRLCFIPKGQAASSVVDTLIEAVTFRVDGSLNMN